jgi:hypothetical protein
MGSPIDYRSNFVHRVSDAITSYIDQLSKAERPIPSDSEINDYVDFIVNINDFESMIAKHGDPAEWNYDIIHEFLKQSGLHDDYPIHIRSRERFLTDVANIITEYVDDLKQANQPAPSNTQVQDYIDSVITEFNRIYPEEYDIEDWSEDLAQCYITDCGLYDEFPLEPDEDDNSDSEDDA